MKKKIKDTLKAMAIDPPHIFPPHNHGMGCDECKTFGRYFRDTYPPPVFQTEKIVYRIPWQIHFGFGGILIAAIIAYYGWSYTLKNPIEKPYPVYIHDSSMVDIYDEPWKTKCQKAWTILNNDRDAGRAAFRVLNQ